MERTFWMTHSADSTELCSWTSVQSKCQDSLHPKRSHPLFHSPKCSDQQLSQARKHKIITAYLPSSSASHQRRHFQKVAKCFQKYSTAEVSVDHALPPWFVLVHDGRGFRTSGAAGAIMFSIWRLDVFEKSLSDQSKEDLIQVHSTLEKISRNVSWRLRDKTKTAVCLDTLSQMENNIFISRLKYMRMYKWNIHKYTHVYARMRLPSTATNISRQIR